MGNSPSTDSGSVLRTFRNEKPMDYTLKFRNFSFLAKAMSTEKTQYNRYESQIFNASGYKWKLVLHPNGIEEGNKYISLYLVTVEDDILSAKLELNVMFTFLIYDCIRDKYLAIQDGRIRRFHWMKTKWGFEKLLSVSTFKNASNGLLVKDCCVFGVDIAIVKQNEVKGEVFSFVQPKKNTFIWRVPDFLSLKQNSYLSEVFTVQGCCWKLTLYPRGDSRGAPDFVSLFLELQNLKDFPQGFRVYVECEIAVLSQLGDEATKILPKIERWFGSEEKSWGYSEFMSLEEVEEPKKGFLYDNNTLIIEAKINAISILKKSF